MYPLEKVRFWQRKDLIILFLLLTAAKDTERREKSFTGLKRYAADTYQICEKDFDPRKPRRRSWAALSPCTHYNFSLIAFWSLYLVFCVFTTAFIFRRRGFVHCVLMCSKACKWSYQIGVEAKMKESHKDENLIWKSRMFWGLHLWQVHRSLAEMFAKWKTELGNSFRAPFCSE